MSGHSEYYKIQTEKDVDDLLQSKSNVLVQVIIRSPQIAEHDLVRLESKINHHLTACGCEAAAVAAIGGLAASFAWLIIRPQGLWPVGVMDIVLLAAAFVIPATASKGLGTLWHQRQARRALAELKTHMEERISR